MILAAYVLIIITAHGVDHAEFYSEKACNTALVKVVNETNIREQVSIMCGPKGEQ